MRTRMFPGAGRPLPRWVPAGLLAFGLLAAPSAHANLFSDTGLDPRQPCPRTLAPYSAIGMVESIGRVPWQDARLGPMESFIHGTGFMISPCFALTNFHIVFGDGRDNPVKKAKHYAWISLGGEGAAFALKVPAAVVAWGDFSRRVDADWAILEVLGCPGGNPRIGWLTAADAAPSDQPQVWEAGFDWEDGAPKFEQQERCSLGAAHGPLTVETFCPARPGWSGSPIGLRMNGALPQVLAMNSREQRPVPATLARRDPTRANLAVVVREAIAQSGLGPLIQKDIAAAAEPTP